MEFKMGYAASIESHRPMEALEEVVRAEKLGFDSLWVEDHFHPWFHKTVDGKLAQSGFAWTWMSSALQATKKLPIGTAVTAPILRYHPAIVAQAWATMGQMYPGRAMIAVGAGEALNEIPTLGIDMPSNTDRRNMTVEATKLMKELWESDKPVTFNGKFYKTRDAFLYTKPEKKIPVYFSGIGPIAAKAAGTVADHLLTTVIDPDMVKNVSVPAFHAGLKEVGKDPAKSEIALLNWYAIDEDYDKALKALHVWGACLDPNLMKENNVYKPEECSERACNIPAPVVDKMFICATSVEELIKRVEAYKRAGVTHMIMGNTSPNTDKGMDALKEVVAAFKG